MMRTQKIQAVAAFEFLSEVKRPSYIILVLGMPVFILAYGVLIALVGAFAAGSKTDSVYGVVDEANVLTLDSTVTRQVSLPEEAEQAMRSFSKNPDLQAESFGQESVKFREYPDTVTAMAALKDRNIKGWFYIRTDYHRTGNVDSYIAEAENLNMRDAERALREMLRDNLLQGALPEALGERIKHPLNMENSWLVKPNGELTERSMESVIAKVGVPFIFTILLLLSVIGTGMSLIQGTSVEKENRVVDVLLSSASADEVLTGKLLGLGAAGLLQVCAWFGMAGLAGVLFAAKLSGMGVSLLWGPLAIGVLYFTGAYFFIGSLMLGSGALGNNFKEGQQWSIVWILMTTLPMVFMAGLIRQPHSLMAKMLTWFPFSSYSIVTFRLWMDPAGIEWWEIAGPFVFLLACIWIAVKVGARLFRLGLLLTGTRLKPSEIFKQMKMNA